MMPPEEYDLIKLSENINKLMDLIRAQRLEIGRLQAELSRAELDKDDAFQRLNIAEARSQALLTLRAVAGSNEETAETKQRLDRLIKDIDRCIKLLELE